jgi:hypothetical protein
MKYYSNTISFFPDNLNYTLTPADLLGWYTLYPPNDQNERNTPALIFFDPLEPTYLGWTTIVPLNCIGSSNYQVGRCQLIFQRLEDNRRFMKDSNQNQSSLPVGKDMIPVTGRISERKSQYKLNQVEIYCLYADFERCKGTIMTKNQTLPPATFAEWDIGFMTYAKTMSSILVSGTTFGQYIKGVIREIGSFSDYTASLTPHQVVDNGFELPLVDPGVAEPLSSFTYLGRVLTFRDLEFESDVKIVFPVETFGSIPDSPGRTLTISEFHVNIVSINPSFRVDLGDLSFMTSFTDFTIYIGNQKFTQRY